MFKAVWLDSSIFQTCRLMLKTQILAPRLADPSINISVCSSMAFIMNTSESDAFYTYKLRNVHLAFLPISIIAWCKSTENKLK